jgi:GT2 family glycosyltransferase
MDSPPVSVVVVSRERPDALMRCLNGLAQLDYPLFEIVCVACPAGITALSARSDAERIKTVAFDRPNISEARNLGITEAAGEIVAFIDDDAVPEPLWLWHLTAPFSEPNVAATGGYVIGRNGISFQWKARAIDRTGEASELDVKGDQPCVLHPQPDRAIKTEGTNMAVRRDLLAEMGGFDPSFRFYLDETDLNQRLADMGQATAIVPLAQVHHGFAPSARRRSDRTPTDLFEIGASKAVYLRKHCPSSQQEQALDTFCRYQNARLLRLMQNGQLDPLDVVRLRHGLRRGFKDGQLREINSLPRIPRAGARYTTRLIRQPL